MIVPTDSSTLEEVSRSGIPFFGSKTVTPTAGCSLAAVPEWTLSMIENGLDLVRCRPGGRAFFFRVNGEETPRRACRGRVEPTFAEASSLEDARCTSTKKKKNKKKNDAEEI